MELRRELLLTIGGLVLLNLLLAYGSMGLFVRMGPAIEQILQENVYSIMAAETILAEFAQSDHRGLSEEAQNRIQLALDNAKRNVTEVEEEPVLASIQDRLPQAMAGDHRARKAVVLALQRLIVINRDTMVRVDGEAQRLGRSGAWAAVFVGLASFLLSIIIITRFQKRFVEPLVELYEVLEAARDGNPFRRCKRCDAPREVIQVTQSVNRLLDERRRRQPPTHEPPS